MGGGEAPDIVEHLSARPFDATLDRLTDAIARAAGLEMPPATVLTYGHPRGGTPVMVAAPLTALDLPLRALVHVREDGRTAIAFRPIGAVLRRAGVPGPLAGRLGPAQQLLVDAVGP